jgi:hypothetical protein
MAAMAAGLGFFAMAGMDGRARAIEVRAREN